ncbi:MAG: tetratricopeptide repeat protein, partial [Gammaproteobacteria bacterium]|nr:tetratricopeptide repeat protein [Gammaproteobacteria bacterium]
NPDLSPAWSGLARAQLDDGRAVEAEASARRALSTSAPDREAYTVLGAALMAQGRLSEARKSYETAVAWRDGAEARMRLGSLEASLPEKRLDRAERHYRRALELDPQRSAAHVRLGWLYFAQGRYPEAEDEQRAALAIHAEDGAAHHGLAAAIMQMGRYEEAVACYARAGDLEPRNTAARLGVAEALLALDRVAEAVEQCDHALARDPDDADALALRADLDERQGRIDEAARRLAGLIERGTDNVNVLLVYSNLARETGDLHDAIGRIKDVLQDEHMEPHVRRRLRFALAHLHDAAGEHDQAFAHLRAGHEIQRVPFDPLRHERMVDELIHTWSRELIDALPLASNHAERPLFIVGMPRSGTTLVEQILSGHPRVEAGGELREWPHIVGELRGRVGAAPDAPWPEISGLTRELVDELAGRYLARLDAVSTTAARITDKRPANYMDLGPIRQFFPAARVVHCKRDPLDTCVSYYFQDFLDVHPHADDLGHLGLYYRCYERVMAHWRQVLDLPIFTVVYEDLVNDPARVVADLLEFCGLEWDERCLAFNEQERFVATVSYSQVRRPLSARSIERWRRYEAHLGPLIEALGLRGAGISD